MWLLVILLLTFLTLKDTIAVAVEAPLATDVAVAVVAVVAVETGAEAGATIATPTTTDMEVTLKVCHSRVVIALRDLLVLLALVTIAVRVPTLLVWQMLLSGLILCILRCG